jgi:hydrogenase nickel incorporation protein HypA/HybF
MHELALTCSIVDLVEEAAQGRRVRRVTVEIGALSGVMADAIAFCFPEVARETVAEDAELDIRRIEARARCNACGAEFATPALYTPCACGSLDLDRLCGEELNVRSMELEAA